MGLSEQQLTSWSNQGATNSSATTYNSIKAALDAHVWPKGMKYEVYLQGSYPNATNIRGNSDVDIVVELTSVFYSNLTDEQKKAFGFGPADFSYTDLRREVIAALQEYYGTTDVVTTGANAITVAAGGSRLKADVLPCVEYRHYNGGTPVYGVQFFNQHTNDVKINYPKVHINNGSTKNSENGTRGWYKPSVRIFKNARESVIGSSDELRKRYPSYFVECLLFNVPNTEFGGSYRDTYANAVNFLNAGLADGRGDRFTTQNQQQYLFGSAQTQWSLDNAKRFVADLISLWNNN